MLTLKSRAMTSHRGSHHSIPCLASHWIYKYGHQGYVDHALRSLSETIVVMSVQVGGTAAQVYRRGADQAVVAVFVKCL